MAQNECSPASIYGPLNQTLFLGCSVVSFQASAGWNEQASELTVTLVQDPCETPAESPKYYYDTDLIERTTTAADPGFIGETLPIVGCAAYFRLGNFEYCGIIQSWEKENSPSANPTYIVKLVSPVRILQNTQLIVGEYTGPLRANTPFSQSPTNLLNVYGFAETVNGVESPQYYQSSPGTYNEGDAGTDGAMFGTAGGGYGGSKSNVNGIQWSVIRNMLNSLTSAVPVVTNQWSPHGRILHRGLNLNSYGSPWTNGYGLLPGDTIANTNVVSEYFVDVAECPDVSDQLRFSGANLNLLEVISRVMSESGYDYYLEMLPLRNQIASGSGIAKLIKVRAVARTTQPNFGSIEEYIDNARDSGRLISSSYGRELRDDATSSFVVGGPKQVAYQAYASSDPDGDGDPEIPELDDMIVPYFGEDISGNLLRVRKDNLGYWEFEADTRPLNQSLEVLSFNTDFIVINERELLESLDIGAWESYIRFNASDSYQPIQDAEIEFRVSLDKLATIRSNMASGTQYSARDLIGWNTVASNISSLENQRKERDVQKIYNWVSTFANEYYGRKFAIRIPYVSVKLDEYNSIPTYSEMPTNDGGWTEETGILDLPNNTIYTDFFKDDYGKIQTFVQFDAASGLDLADLNSNDYILYNNKLYLKGNVEERITFVDRNSLYIPRVVVEIPNVISISEEERSLFQAIHAIAHGATGGAIADEAARIPYNIGAAGIFSPYSKLALTPNAVCFGIRSNVNTYGPWSNVGIAGGIRIEKNDGLVPWEFGGYQLMNTAANELVDAGLVNMQVGEMGTVTVAGYPELPLGAEINSASILGGKQLIENRFSSYNLFAGNFVGGSPFTYNCLTYDYGFIWGGTYGPNITSISVSAGAEGITTTYSMRTYTPSFGRFAELNATRLKNIGQQRLQYERKFRQRTAAQDRINEKRSAVAGNVGKGISSKFKNIRKEFIGASPHEILGAQLLNWNISGESGNKIPIAASFSLSEATTELNTGTYRNKALMSLDGLLRPFSLDGDGGLSRFVSSTGSGSTSATNATYIVNSGYKIIGTTGSSSSSVFITNRDLNPFANPAGYSWSELSAKHVGSKGHDIDIVARGTGIPSGGMVIRHGGTGLEPDYRNDYRPLGLRGPLVVVGWGYTTEGKPIPNATDTESGMLSGIWKATGTTNQFYPDWLQKSHLWPAGPVDLRFDVGRGVWTVASNEPEIYGRLLGHLGPNNSVGVMNLDTGTFIRESGTSGNITGYTAISGWNRTNNLYASGCELKFKYSSSFGRWEVNSNSEITILITGTISGAIWDRNITGLKPYRFSMPIFDINPTSGGLESGFIMYNTGTMVTGWHKYTDTITPGSNQAYVGKLVNGWLENLDCRKVSLI